MGFIQWTKWSKNLDSGTVGMGDIGGRSAAGSEAYLPVLF